MKKRPASHSAFFSPRVLISVAFCAIGLCLALIAFALYPGGNAFAARQNQSLTQDQSRAQDLAQETVTVLDGTVEQESVSTQAVPVAPAVKGVEIDATEGTPCTFSNGGLNPQALTESGVAAPAGFLWSEVQHDAGNLAESNTTAGISPLQGTFRLADNFTLTQPCTLNSVAFYAYQTGAPASPSPFTAYTLQIHNGRPGDAGVMVIFGDTTTNRLASTVDSTFFRIFNTAVPPPGIAQGTTRKIWENTVTIGTTLPAGTYWLDWASTISTAGAHFQPTKTIAGARSAPGDNARQLTVGTGAWADVLDAGNPAAAPDVAQDFPFDISGTATGPTPTPTPGPTGTPGGTPTPTPCTVTVGYTGPPVAIPDNVPAGVDIVLPVSGVGTISDLNFQFDALAGCSTTIGNPNASVTHTFLGDLSFKLTSPGGTTVNLIVRRGGGGDNYCTVLLDDDGGFPPASTIPSTGAVSGNFAPETPLFAFDGQNANGNWTLNVSDNAGDDTGTLNRFSLIFGSTCPTPTPTPPGTPTPTPTATPTGGVAQALNLSTRLLVQGGDNVGIGGFIITGSAPKQVLLRGIGPSLTAFGVPNALADPVLELNGSGGFITITNNNWKDTQQAAIEATGIPPTNDLESAILVTLNPGSYTAILRGQGNSSGVALIEVYDLSQAVASKLGNIATRAFVNTGNDIVIAGFILGNGMNDDRIVVRGIGPSLTAFGVPNALANPTLELRNSSGAVLASNNDWQDNAMQAAELTALGLAPTNALESGIVATLAPGAYTALLSGVNNGTGNALVEVYDNPVAGPTATP